MPCALSDAGNDGLELPQDLMLTHPQHVPPGLTERAFTRGIMPSALLVVSPV